MLISLSLSTVCEGSLSSEEVGTVSKELGLGEDTHRWLDWNLDGLT